MPHSIIDYNILIENENWHSVMTMLICLIALIVNTTILNRLQRFKYRMGTGITATHFTVTKTQMYTNAKYNSIQIRPITVAKTPI